VLAIENDGNKKYTHGRVEWYDQFSLEDSIRIPFVMHYEGFKYQEIADEFNLPLGTVKSRIFFARKALKDMIKENYGDYSLVRSLSA
jgi:hypothetical protein